MLKRQVPLHNGLVLSADGEPVKSVTIREETAGDELFCLESGISGDLLDRMVTLRRIHAIGPITDPAIELTRKLTRVDFELIEVAQTTMDIELMTEAGLVKKASEAGRDQPGAETPGAAGPDPRSDDAAAVEPR